MGGDSPGLDPRVDAKIAAAADFARPILNHLRALVHRAVPDVQETIKWGMPHFVYRGKNLAGMAAFKAHCAFVLHGEPTRDDAMGQFGRIATPADLPDDAEIERRLRAGCEAIDQTLSQPRRAKAPASAKPKDRAAPQVPDDLREALAASPAADQFMAGLTSAQQRDYLEWIASAKRPETRAARISTTVSWLAEGKRHNWKYQKG